MQVTKLSMKSYLIFIHPTFGTGYFGLIHINNLMERSYKYVSL